MRVIEWRVIVRGLVLVAGAAGLNGAYAGEMYRWTDADGKVHFSDQPTGDGAKAVELDRSRMSVVDTVVVKDNAMRSVVNQEVNRQKAQRAATLKAAEAAEARAERDKERRCASLRRQMTRAENSPGSLINGRLNQIDDQYGKECR